MFKLKFKQKMKPNFLLCLTLRRKIPAYKGGNQVLAKRLFKNIIHYFKYSLAYLITYICTIIFYINSLSNIGLVKPIYSYNDKFSGFHR